MGVATAMHRIFILALLTSVFAAPSLRAQTIMNITNVTTVGSPATSITFNLAGESVTLGYHKDEDGSTFVDATSVSITGFSLSSDSFVHLFQLGQSAAVYEFGDAPPLLFNEFSGQVDGRWAPVATGYVEFKATVASATYYGWLRLETLDLNTVHFLPSETDTSIYGAYSTSIIPAGAMAAAVPEPASVAALLGGAAILSVIVVRRRKQES